MKELKGDFEGYRVIYNNNPIDKWCLYNSREKRDINGNTQIVKELDRTQRIDGAVALLCAYKVLKDKLGQYINLNEGADEQDGTV